MKLRRCYRYILSGVLALYVLQPLCERGSGSFFFKKIYIKMTSKREGLL